MNGLWWWCDRWRKSTAYTDLTLEEQGAYRNLLDEACLRGGALPTDERILAKVCGDALAWPRVREVVLARFERREDGWHNQTLDAVLEESAKRSQKQAAYRNAAKTHAPGNAPGNADSNGGGNGGGNAPGNAGRPLNHLITHHLITGSGAGSPSQAPPAAAVPRPRTAQNGRLTIHRWQIEELLQRLGDHAEAFNLDAWLWNDLSARTRPVFATRDDQWQWVQEQFAAEVARRQLPTPGKPGDPFARSADVLRQAEADLKARGR